MYKVYLYKPEMGDMIFRMDVTDKVGSIEWETSFSVTAALDFKASERSLFNPGDTIFFEKDGVELFRGIVASESTDKTGRASCTAYDYSWYLHQSTTVMQFNGISATEAIRQVLDRFGVALATITEMPTLIEGIFMLKTPGQIIQEIVDKVEKSEGYKLNAEMRGGQLYIEKSSDLVIAGSFSIAGAQVPIERVITDASRKRSIEEMRNRIRLIVEDEETEYEVTAETENEELIRKYGVLEETTKIEPGDSAKSRQVAKMLLARLGRVHEENSISLIGDARFVAGRLFDVDEPKTGLSGRFMITSAKHSFSKGLHTMALELALPEDVM